MSRNTPASIRNVRPSHKAACIIFAAVTTRNAETTAMADTDRKSTRLNSSHVKISYAVFCLKKKKPEAHRAAHRVRSTETAYPPHLPTHDLRRQDRFHPHADAHRQGRALAPEIEPHSVCHRA